MSTEMINVGCKLPNGMLLELGKRGQEGHRQVMLNGANAQLIHTANGFGITAVPKDFAEAWFKKHGWLACVKGGHVFMEAEKASAQARAMEHTDPTGLEPLDPDKAPPSIEVDPEHLRNVRRMSSAAQRR